VATGVGLGESLGVTVSSGVSVGVGVGRFYNCVITGIESTFWFVSDCGVIIIIISYLCIGSLISRSNCLRSGVGVTSWAKT